MSERKAWNHLTDGEKEERKRLNRIDMDIRLSQYLGAIPFIEDSFTTQQLSYFDSIPLDIKKIMISKIPANFTLFSNPEIELSRHAILVNPLLLGKVKNKTEILDDNTLSSFLDVVKDQLPKDEYRKRSDFLIHTITSLPKIENIDLLAKLIKSFPEDIYFYRHSIEDVELQRLWLSEAQGQPNFGGFFLEGIFKHRGYPINLITKDIIEIEPKSFQFLINPNVDLCIFALDKDPNNFKFIKIVDNPDPKTTMTNLLKKKIILENIV